MVFVPPVIDLRPLRTGDRSAVESLHRACTETGFFVVTDHGAEAPLDVAHATARAFFDLPQADKERVPRVDRYGFVPHSATAIDLSRASDRTEYLDMGMAADAGDRDTGAAADAGDRDRAPLPEIPGLAVAVEDAVRAYQDAALEVGRVILSALALALGIEPDFFDRRMVSPQCRLRFLHYPPVEPAADRTLPVPTEPHTDYGLVTLLATDGVPGLEVRPIGADWVPVPTERGQLVVNLGDMMARWTNDLYRSTPHRVVGPARGDRISIPFFVNPDPATVVETIPSCVTDERPLHYQPVTAGQFLIDRIDSADEPYVDRAPTQ